jgi:hypothetical protein
MMLQIVKEQAFAAMFVSGDIVLAGLSHCQGLCQNFAKVGPWHGGASMANSPFLGHSRL